MEAYSIYKYYTTCNHCKKGTIHQAPWIDFGQSLKHTYKCGWCGKVTSSTWTFAHESLVNLLVPMMEGMSGQDLPHSFHQYP
jgi:uncharacterized Zn finger protein